jgi:hypothetical protein
MAEHYISSVNILGNNMARKLMAPVHVTAKPKCKTRPYSKPVCVRIGSMACDDPMTEGRTGSEGTHIWTTLQIVSYKANQLRKCSLS